MTLRHHLPSLCAAAVLLTPLFCQAQAPTYQFDTGTGAANIAIGGSPADANLAVSTTHVVVSARGAFACYTKGGMLVAPGPGFTARPYTAKEFFEGNGISTIISVNGDSNTSKDGHVVFDVVKRRFFIVFESREATARLLIACSKSEDPRDGWWAYADVVGSPGEPAHDYPHVGVNATSLLVSNPMISSWSGGSLTRVRHLLYSTANLAAGTAYTRNEWNLTAANGAIPCVHDTSTTDAFWVSRDDDTHATVWGLRSGAITSKQVTVQTSELPFDSLQLGGSTVGYSLPGNYRNFNLAEYRNGSIVAVSNDGKTWAGHASKNNAVRLVKFGVSQFYAGVPSVSVIHDRIFGLSSAGDPANSTFDYGWPAVSTNSLGDIVVGSIRTNSSVYPQHRASVWYAGDADISSSVLTATSSSPLSSWHVAGAASDPATTAVYLCQQYGATNPSWRIRVVKMLGTVQPDVITTLIQPPASLAPGCTGTVSVTILNQGDGVMPLSYGDLRLSSNNFVSTGDLEVGSFSIPPLDPNESITIAVTVSIPAGQTPGAWFIGARLYSRGTNTEASETNNTNPFLAGPYGNVAMTIAPLNAALLNVVSLTKTPGGHLIKFSGAPGNCYLVQYSDNLAAGTWLTAPLAGPLMAGPTGAFQWEDTTAPEPKRRFYRAITP